MTGPLRVIPLAAHGAEDVVVAPDGAVYTGTEDGTVWFTDSSTVHDIDHWKEEMVQETWTGRLFRRDPDGTVTLPGYPDNISRGSDGLIWVTLAEPTDTLVGLLRDHAPLWLRKQVTRIPERLQPRRRRSLRVRAYDDAGRVVHDLDLPADDFHTATGVREHHGRVWLGSLHEPAIAVVDL